jgi:hypothetical protein
MTKLSADRRISLRYLDMMRGKPDWLSYVAPGVFIKSKTFAGTLPSGGWLDGPPGVAGYPFNTVGWSGKTIPNNISIENWWSYEQNAIG